jgi:hypothetical protein
MSNFRQRVCPIPRDLPIESFRQDPFSLSAIRAQNLSIERNTHLFKHTWSDFNGATTMRLNPLGHWEIYPERREKSTASFVAVLHLNLSNQKWIPRKQHINFPWQSPHKQWNRSLTIHIKRGKLAVWSKISTISRSIWKWGREQKESIVNIVLKLQREEKHWTLAQRDAYRLDGFTIRK